MQEGAERLLHALLNHVQKIKGFVFKKVQGASPASVRVDGKVQAMDDTLFDDSPLSPSGRFPSCPLCSSASGVFLVRRSRGKPSLDASGESQESADPRRTPGIWPDGPRDSPGPRRPRRSRPQETWCTRPCPWPSDGDCPTGIFPESARSVPTRLLSGRGTPASPWSTRSTSIAGGSCGSERSTPDSIQGFFDWFGTEKSRAFCFIASDRRGPFVKVMAQRAPQVLPILDRSPIMAPIGMAIDEIRSEEVRTLRSQGKQPLPCKAQGIFSNDRRISRTNRRRVPRSCCSTT